MIKFNNVTKVFNNTLKAVDDLSFTVNKGEIVGFIGPNGSGKTTTIKNMPAIFAFMENAMMILPIQSKGERTNIRRQIIITS